MPTKSQDSPSVKICNETNSCNKLITSMPVDAVPSELPDGQELLNMSPKSSKYMEVSWMMNIMFIIVKFYMFQALILFLSVLELYTCSTHHYSTTKED